MTIVRRIARPLLAAPLIAGGVDAFRHPGPHAEAARPLVSRASGPLRLPDDPELIVRASGAVSAVGGTLLALGRLPRLSALAIALATPTAQASTPFWQEKDPEAKRAQRTVFLKNLGLLGGALLAAVDTEGKPSLAWRGRRAGRAAASSVEDLSGATKKVAKRQRKEAAKSAKAAKASTAKALKKGRDAVPV